LRAIGVLPEARDLRAAFRAGFRAGRRAAFRAGRRATFRAVRRVAFRAADRLRPADLRRPRTLLRAFFERVFRFAIPSILPMPRPLASVAL
jgi:hypothetical protein